MSVSKASDKVVIVHLNTHTHKRAILPPRRKGLIDIVTCEYVSRLVLSVIIIEKNDQNQPHGNDSPYLRNMLIFMTVAHGIVDEAESKESATRQRFSVRISDL